MKTARLDRFVLRGEGVGVVADLNGDGHLDLLFCSASQITTLLGRGHASFTRGPSSPGLQAMAVAVGDFNKDGRIDLVATIDESNSIAFWKGLGGGSFSSPSFFKVTQSGVRGIVAADFNSDGRLDVACVNEWSGTVSVFAGNGQGGFSPLSVGGAGQQPKRLFLADVNLDGLPDLVTTGMGASVLMGDGKGSFAKTSYLSSGGANSSCAAVADLNGDGKPDIVLSSSLSRLISLLPGDGQGNFGLPVVLREARYSSSVATADFNSDGFADIVTTEGILLGDGSGNFREVPALPQNEFGGHLVVADFSGDRILDLLLLENGATLLLGDGEGGIANNSGRSGWRLAATDLNGDGYQDVLTTSGGISVFLGKGSGLFTRGKDVLRSGTAGSRCRLGVCDHRRPERRRETGPRDRHDKLSRA
jgi:hypothetical protein